MCWVCERSSAASISSKMYIGAGLNWRRDMIRERAMRELDGREVLRNGVHSRRRDTYR